MTQKNPLTVARRLGLGFGLLVLLMAGVAAAGVYGLQRSSQALDSIYNERTVPMTQLAKVHYLATRDRVVLTDALIHGKPDTTAKRVKQFEANREASNKAWADYAQEVHSGEEQELAAQAAQTLAVLVDQGFRPMAAALQAGQADEARRILDTKISPLNPAFVDAMEALLALQVKLAAGEHAQALVVARSAITATLAVTALGLVAGVAAGAFITRRLVRALGAEPEALAAVARRIADGQLADDGTAAAPVGSVMASMQSMRSGLLDMVSQVRTSVDSVATASAQIAQGNLDLSGRTEQQASSLQETAASMEQLTGTVRHSAQTAQQADQLARGASDTAARGGAVVARVVQTMSDIQGASKRIAEITGVIDGIAFQTNILALNAAVEAARAGEQGRGFAVVASEVRTLAQRSAEAAKQIKTLIGESVVQVEAGGVLVADAGRTMQEVVSDVQRVSDLITEISHAAREQGQGIEQVGQAVGLLDQTTQQNAALVEESAAAAASLKAQAMRLSEAVAAFHVEAVPA